jgi:hypothetical protein
MLLLDSFERLENHQAKVAKLDDPAIQGMHKQFIGDWIDDLSSRNLTPRFSESEVLCLKPQHRIP